MYDLVPGMWLLSLPRSRAFRGALRILLVIALVGFSARLTKADSLTVGLISFDNLVPAAPGAAGVNVFTLYNFTGSNSFPPDAPVVSSLDFLNTTVTLDGSDVVNAATISPGSVQSPSLEFSTTDNFTEADFSAQLSSLTFSANGQTYLASSSTVTATLLPSTLPDLIAGTDFVTIEIEASPISAPVPEPGGFALVILGLMMLAAVAAADNCHRKRAHSAIGV